MSVVWFWVYQCTGVWLLAAAVLTLLTRHNVNDTIKLHKRRGGCDSPTRPPTPALPCHEYRLQGNGKGDEKLFLFGGIGGEFVWSISHLNRVHQLITATKKIFLRCWGQLLFGGWMDWTHSNRGSSRRKTKRGILFMWRHLKLNEFVQN